MIRAQATNKRKYNTMATKPKQPAPVSTNAPVMPNAVTGVIQFEPTAAPLTKGRALDSKDEAVSYSLRHDDGRIFVYGADDVRNHGEANQVTRLNSLERYTDSTYVDLVKVLFLHLFAKHRGESSAITPTGVISVPISVYNDAEQTEKIKASIAGNWKIEDAQGCILRIKIDPAKLGVLPESVGALQHYAFDHKTLKPRPDNDASGNVLVVDIGYLTTDMSLHTDAKFLRNRATTEPTIGMQRITQRVQDMIRDTGRDVDISQVDAGLRLLSGLDKGSKFATIGGHRFDVSGVYDPSVTILAQQLRDAIMNRYHDAIALVLLTGGGAYHLGRYMTDLLPFPTVTCPDPAVANVLGGYTRIARGAAAKNSTDLLYSLDVGNGTAKGVSSESL